MRLILKVHYKNGPFLSYIAAEALHSRRLDDNYEYGYLCFKNGLKINTKDIRNIEFSWEEEKVEAG